MKSFETKILDFFKKNIFYFGGAILLLFSVYLRIIAIPQLNGDLIGGFLPWVDEFRANGGFIAMRQGVGNYNYAYQTILAALSYLPFEPIYLVKSIPIFFDYVLAFASAMVVYNLVEPNRRKLACFIAFFVVLNLPTVFMNSAVWGQCESISTSAIVLSIWALTKDRPALAMFLFGVALSFKLQPIVFIPALLLIYFCSRRFSVFNFLLIPVGMIVPSLGAIFVGHGIRDIFRVYFSQVSLYAKLTMNYPNIYCWLPENYSLFSKIGIVLTFTVLLIGYMLVILKTKKLEVKDYISVFIWTGYVCVFFLPAMHERYGYAVEILFILYSLINKRFFLLSIGLCLIGAISYLPFLMGFNPIDQKYLAVISLIIFISATMAFFKDFLSERGEIRLKETKA